MDTLSDDEINEALESLSEWNRRDEHIRREYSLANFVEAVELVNALVDPAEELNHHPDLEVSWGSVVVNLTTHDAGGLTRNDFTLAETYDRLFEENFS